MLPYTDKHWEAFFGVVETPETFEDARFATFAARVSHQEHVWGVVAERLARFPSALLAERFAASDIPFSVVNSLDDLIRIRIWRMSISGTTGSIRPWDSSGCPSTPSSSAARIRWPVCSPQSWTSRDHRSAGMRLSAGSPAVPMMSDPAARTGPLGGIKVLELEGIGPGPHGAMLLGDLGADVLTILRTAPVQLAVSRPDRLAPSIRESGRSPWISNRPPGQPPSCAWQSWRMC